MQKHQIASGDIFAEINSMGGGLSSLRIKQSDTELLGHWPSSTDGGMTSGFVMAPVIGLVSNDGKVLHQGQVFEPGKHGFARKSIFTQRQHTRDSLLLEYVHDPKKSPGVYPFHHRIEVEYAVHGRELTTRFSIINLDYQTMYYGAGLHPAFQWPLPGSQNRDNHSLGLSLPLPEDVRVYRPADGKIRADATDANPFSEEGIWPLTANDFQKDAFFFIQQNDTPLRGLTYKSENGNNKLRFLMEGWDGFGIWSKPGEEHRFICVEPLAGVAITEKTASPPELKDIHGLKQLRPGESFTAKMHVLVL